MERFKADLQNQVSKLQTEVSATKAQLSETQKKFADMKADRDRLQYDIRKLKKEVDSSGTCVPIWLSARHSTTRILDCAYSATR